MRRPRITYANAMATLALLLVVGGTATAAATRTPYSGANTADGSLTGMDVRDDTLKMADLSTSAKASFLGEKGATGPVGSKGPTGVQGPRGADGPRGSAAFMTSAYAWRDTGLTTWRPNSLVPNNGPGNTGNDWDSPDYANATSGGPYPNIRAAGTYQSVALNTAWAPMLSLTGMSGTDTATRSADTMLRVSFDGASMNVNGTVTLLHRSDGESLATNDGGTLRHGRVRCALFTGTSTDPAQLTTPVGVEAWASSGTDDLHHELVQVAINGSVAGLAAGASYNVTMKCRDADFTGNTQWQLTSGNLTALASQ